MSSAITNLRRQFMQRRLWPVAILLVVALAAVPVVLAQDPAPLPPAPPALAADTGGLAAEPIVAPAVASLKRRKVLGSAKNPFGVAPDSNATSATDDVPIVTQQEPGSGDTTSPVDGSKPPSAGGDTPSPSSPGTTGPSTPSPVDPTLPQPESPAPDTHAQEELTVRFGSADGLQRQSLKRLQPLPSAEEPVLIYLGVLRDGKTAVFLVDHGVAAMGDGECLPSPDDCQTLRLRAGETEFLDVKDEAGLVVAQYQLDLIKIHKGGTDSALDAIATSKAGKRVLKARISADGPTGYRWNPRTGTLETRRAVLRSTVGRSSAQLP